MSKTSSEFEPEFEEKSELFILNYKSQSAELSVHSKLKTPLVNISSQSQFMKTLSWEWQCLETG